MRNPLTLLADLSTADSRAYLNGRIGSVVGRMWAAWIVLVGAAVMVGGYLPASLLAFVVGGLAGLAACRAAMATWLRANAYRTGWIEGRTALLASMREAQEADKPAHVWVREQMDHDLGMFR